MNPRLRNYLLLITGCAVLLILGMTGTFAASFAKNGGQVNLMSPSNTVDIQADSVGDVVSIAGNRNTVQRPYEATTESNTHKAGERVALALWSIILVGTILIMAMWLLTNRHQISVALNQKGTN